MAKDSLREYGPLLFVVQQRHARQLHYDLRLECDGVLKSWTLPKGPSLDPSEKRFAAQTEDHPYDYGAFEGVIPAKQYGAGEVIVWDCGVYSPDEGNVTWFDDRERAEREVREGLENGKLSFQLRGEKLKGSFALVRMKDPKQWLVIKHKDRFVSASEITLRDRSVLSGIGVDDLKAIPAHRVPAASLVPAGPLAPMPAKLSPMRPSRVSARSITPTGCGSRSSTATACSLSSARTGSSCARNKGSTSRAGSPASPRS
ncbi:MAG: DNA polymerase ligase N-terminal domain-containing protein [Usitatibacter sp.]